MGPVSYTHLLGVTNPFWSTVATSLLLLDHISSLLVAFLGSIVAVSWSVSSNATVFLPVIIISVTFTSSAALDVTVTLQLASLPPSAFTVMIASPGDTAVTFPFWSTVATPGVPVSYTHLDVYKRQVIQRGILAVGNLVLRSGYAGTLIYGIIERALIPFGLHHVFYIPFWQTSVGGTAVINGVVVEGAQNIFFAELANPDTIKFSSDATRFMAGKFPFMIFGLPGAAFAMYRTAKPERKKAVGGLLLSAALTSLLTGITEPLELSLIHI